MPEDIIGVFVIFIECYTICIFPPFHFNELVINFNHYELGLITSICACLGMTDFGTYNKSHGPARKKYGPTRLSPWVVRWATQDCGFCAALPSGNDLKSRAHRCVLQIIYNETKILQLPYHVSQNGNSCGTGIKSSWFKAFARASVTVRRVLVIAHGCVRLERLYVYNPYP